MNRPKVVITRAREQASELAVRLLDSGFQPLELPVIEMREPEDWSPVDHAVQRIALYDWILFTSANAVRFFGMRLPGGRPSPLIPARVCCIGPKTREAAEAAGWQVSLVPREYVAESVVEAFEGERLEGARILMPRAAVARDVVPVALREKGAAVEVVDVYRNVIPADAPELAEDVFVQQPDWVAFTSSSTVKNLLAIAGPDRVRRARIASIGPVTSETVRKHGLQVDAEAEPHTIEGLVAAMQQAEAARLSRTTDD